MTILALLTSQLPLICDAYLLNIPYISFFFCFLQFMPGHEFLFISLANLVIELPSERLVNLFIIIFILQFCKNREYFSKKLLSDPVFQNFLIFFRFKLVDLTARSHDSPIFFPRLHFQYSRKAPKRSLLFFFEFRALFFSVRVFGIFFSEGFMFEDRERNFSKLNYFLCGLDQACFHIIPSYVSFDQVSIESLCYFHFLFLMELRFLVGFYKNS